MKTRTPPHGGNLRALAEQAACGVAEILDFSANINPLGPPPWLRSVVAGSLSDALHYPDPEALELRRAAAAYYGGAPDEYLAGNGVSDILHACPRLPGLARAIVPVPAYGDYERAARLAGLHVDHLQLRPEAGFLLSFAMLDDMLSGSPAMVFLGRPNNPTGQTFPAVDLLALARSHPDSLFVVDEAFADFIPGLERLAGGIPGGTRPPNVIVLLSLTKFFAVPGLRLGLAAAHPSLIRRLAALLPPWQCSTIAQAVGTRALLDAEYRSRSMAAASEYAAHLYGLLKGIPEISLYPGQANFLLCRLTRGDMDARGLAERLLAHRIAIRVCDNFRGLDETWFRLAVRPPEENERLAEALHSALGHAVPARPRRTPALMVQGTCSNAGKSVLAAGLCRVFLQDGHTPCPFKAQNMSLNSCVTMNGLEMGRAQVTQARPPDASRTRA